MGLLERVNARAEGRSIDAYINDILIPAQQFNYLGTGYTAGLNTTYGQGRIQEVSQTLPSYMAAAQNCPPVFAAQMVRALVLSQARFTFRNPPWHQRTPRRVFGSSALAPLERPWKNATTGELNSRLEWHAGLAGNAYVTKQPNRVRVLRPDWVAIVYGSDLEPEDPMHAIDGDLLGYIYQAGGIGGSHKPITLLPDEVAHWSPIPDPLSPGIGMSWVTPAVRDIQGDIAATDHKLQFFKNGATPNLVVKGLPNTSPQAYWDAVEALEQSHTGVKNAYRTLYLTAGADATVVGSDMKQIDFKATQGSGETRISMLSRVPATILGISEGLAGSSLNAGNFGMARRIFADSWVYPMLQDLAAALAPLVRVPNDAELWFDTTDIPLLREDAKDAADIAAVKSQAIRTLTDGGYDPASTVTTIAPDWASTLQHTGKLSVQLQEPGAQPAEAPPPKKGADPAARPGRRSQGARQLNAGQKRDPDGQFSDGIFSIKGDRLGLAKRIKLADGESLVGSAKARGSQYTDRSAVLAAIATPAGQRLRLGVVRDEDSRRWSAANLGGTLDLDEAQTKTVRDGLVDVRERAVNLLKDYRQQVREEYKRQTAAGAKTEDDLDWKAFPDWETFTAAGEIPGGAWGQLAWSMELGEGDLMDLGATEIVGGAASISLRVKPATAPADWEFFDETENFQDNDPASMGRLVKEIDRLTGGAP